MGPPFKPRCLGFFSCSINTCTCIACVVLRLLYLEVKVLSLEKKACRCHSNSLPIQTLCLTTELPGNTISFAMISRQCFKLCHDRRPFLPRHGFGVLNRCGFSRVAIPFVPLGEAARCRNGPRVIITLSKQSSSTGCS